MWILSFFMLKLPEEAEKIEIFPEFLRWMKKTNIFKCKLRAVHFTIRNRVPFNKLLTNLAFSSRTGEYWPTVVFVQTSLRSVRTVTTSGQYSPVRPSRSVSKRLIFPCSFVEFCNFAWIMRFLTNYAKSCDLRLILWNRNIAEYQKPCNNNINNNNNNNNINHLQKVIVQKSQYLPNTYIKIVSYLQQ